MKKLYYSISEVADMVGVEAHVLRYWETEFKELRPKKNKGGRRVYRESDIELLKSIHRLLKEEKFTIEGARLQLTSGDEAESGEPPQGATRKVDPALRELRSFLEQIRETL